MSKNIYLKKRINSRYFNKSLYPKDKIKLNKIIDNIFTSLDDKKDIFHSLSKKFNFNFKYSELTRFNKYKFVVLIGIGGSASGAKAIYSFCNNRIKKKFYFIDNLEQFKIEKIKKKINLKKDGKVRCKFICLSIFGLWKNNLKFDH